MPSDNVNSRRTQFAALRRWKGADDPTVYRARVALQEETFVSAIQRALRSALPITPELHARVLALLVTGNSQAGR